MNANPDDLLRSAFEQINAHAARLVQDRGDTTALLGELTGILIAVEPKREIVSARALRQCMMNLTSGDFHLAADALDRIRRLEHYVAGYIETRDRNPSKGPKPFSRGHRWQQ